GRGSVAAIAGTDPDLHAVKEHRGHSCTLHAGPRLGGPAEGGCGLQVAERVHALAAVPDGATPDLEVAVRTRRVAGLADAAHRLATPDVLAAADGDRRHVVVGGVEPGAVGDPDLVPAAVALPAGEGDDTAGGRANGRAVVGCDVDRVVAVVEVLADVVVAADDREEEPAAGVGGRALDAASAGRTPDAARRLDRWLVHGPALGARQDED